MWRRVASEVSDRVTVENRRHDKLDEPVYMTLPTADSPSEVHELAERINIEVQRERIRELPHINWSLEVHELEVQDHLGDISWREAGLGELNKRGVFSAPDEVPTEQSALDSRGSRGA